jgi:hypothetical protein
MRCFYHEDKEAVGSCKSCGRGLCRECAVEFPKGLACRGHCEADAQAVIQLVDRSIQLSTTSSRTVQQGRGVRFGAGIFHIAIGVLFFFGGLKDHLLVITLLGVGVFAYGVYWIFLALKLGRQR